MPWRGKHYSALGIPRQACKTASFAVEAGKEYHKECPPQVICHMLPEQLVGLHQRSVCSALHGKDHGAKVLMPLL